MFVLCVGENQHLVSLHIISTSSLLFIPATNGPSNTPHATVQLDYLKLHVFQNNFLTQWWHFSLLKITGKQNRLRIS